MDKFLFVAITEIISTKKSMENKNPTQFCGSSRSSALFAAGEKRGENAHGASGQIVPESNYG